jgi:hypothetical protein
MDIKPGWLILGALAALVIGLCVGFFVGTGSGRRNHEAEAVKAGHAHFVVVNEFGATKFEWLPSHGAEKPVAPAPPVEKK